ncbi:hypothetical protein D3C83_86470 [compost metagenome]
MKSRTAVEKDIAAGNRPKAAPATASAMIAEAVIARPGAGARMARCASGTL